jgi:hypothetical protein
MVPPIDLECFMPVLLGILAALGAVYFFVIRARNAAEMTSEVLDAANDVRLAARRFGFRRQAKRHPADTIEDSNIALAALGCAFVELYDLPTREQRLALTSGLGRVTRLDLDAVEELQTLGRWIMQECGGAQPAIARLARPLNKMQGAAGFENLMELVQGVAKAGSGSLSPKQTDALDDIKRAFRIS